jgi:Lar family restriction alleviation protein
MKTEQISKKAVVQKTYLPCPFCGSSDIMSHIIEGKGVLVWCNSCKVKTPICEGQSVARRCWNRRVEVDDGQT